MRAGLLRNRVKWQTPTETIDGFGDPKQVWATEATLWAQVTDSGASEPTMDGAPEQVQRRTFVVRYRTDIEPNHRLLWPTTSDIWKIEGVMDPEGRQRMVEISAVKHG